MHVFRSIITSTPYLIFSNIVLGVTLYYLCLSFFGIYKPKKKKIFEPKKKFALIVAAHNEEIVIGDMVKSLKRLDYPKELYEVFVIADNCTDKTAEKARQAGAKVFERSSSNKRGKGYALEWMFEKIFTMKESFDSIVVFDADNLAHKDFLKEMNNKLCEGYKVVQGYLDSKNPNDTWITGSYSIAFWSTNRMFQLARNNLKLSNQLGGTGFAIDVDILKDLGWGATCLTEDLEFTCKLVLNGYKVGWAHDAIIYDEKPLTLKQSWKQRVRWMQGFTDVSSRYFFKLMKKAIKEKSFTIFDCALYSIQPIVTILTTILMICNYAISGVRLFTGDIVSQINFNWTTVLLSLLFLLQFIYTPFVLFLEKKLNWKIILYYIIYPIYAITWLPICIQGVLNKNKKEWNHTSHTRSVNIKELEKVN